MLILSPVTDNLLFLNQRKSENILDDRIVDLGAACIRSGKATDRAVALNQCFK